MFGFSKKTYSPRDAAGQFLADMAQHTDDSFKHWVGLLFRLVLCGMLVLQELSGCAFDAEPDDSKLLPRHLLRRNAVTKPNGSQSAAGGQ
jgi:hypothetical protein